MRIWKTIISFYQKQKKNKPKIIYDYNEYLFEKEYGEKIYWRCQVTKPVQCRARIHTNPEKTKIVYKNLIHCHEPDSDGIKGRMVINNIKERAVTTIEKPRRIINECFTELPVSSAPYLTSSKNLTQMINRLRRQVNGFGSDPKQREKVVINDKYKQTVSGKNFLLFDSGEEEDRIIILGTQKNLDLLSRESIWYVDGSM